MNFFTEEKDLLAQQFTGLPSPDSFTSFSNLMTQIFKKEITGFSEKKKRAGIPICITTGYFLLQTDS